MQDPASSHDDLSDLERQLAALSPIGRVDRDRLMYAAGRRAGQRHLRATQRWLAATSAGFGAMLAVAMLNPLWSVGPGQDMAPAVAQHHEPNVEHPPEPQPAVVSNDPDGNYRLLQQLATGAPFDASGVDKTDGASDAVGPDATRSNSRWLLNRYLDESRTRL